jgi:SAM-dependent methyltransferase
LTVGTSAVPSARWRAIGRRGRDPSQARLRAPAITLAPAERLPFADASFDVVFSHEVIEHVNDDRLAAAEMVRVCAPAGRIVLFCPNRLYPFETHGHYWRGKYHFGNTPLINWLPGSLRDRLRRRHTRALRCAVCSRANRQPGSPQHPYPGSTPLWQAGRLPATSCAVSTARAHTVAGL